VRIDQDDRAATVADMPGEDPRFVKWGKQSCTDTGPLTKKRMETVHEEFLGATMDFIDRANLDKKPFFAWFNSTRMHIWTRLKPESQGKTGLGIYPDGMVEHDADARHRQQYYRHLHNRQRRRDVHLAGRRHHAVPRGEKNTNWESSYRVPALVRWPGLVAPHTEINGIFSAEDWVQTCDFTAERQLIMRVRVAICVPA
jgi:arylsulfatase